MRVLLLLLALTSGCADASYFLTSSSNRPEATIDLEDYSLFPVEIVRVIDGDTIVVDINLGLSITLRDTLRLLDIDTWEVTGEFRDQGKMATIVVQGLISLGEEFHIKVPKKRERGKYGRVLARLYIDGVSLNELLKDSSMQKQ